MNDDKTPVVSPPAGCAGCGLRRAVDPDAPAPHETTFNRIEEYDEDVQFECTTCETFTYVPKNPEPGVECRNCGDEIPESLQGSHSCEAHPLGKAADITFDNPFDDYR